MSLPGTNTNVDFVPEDGPSPHLTVSMQVQTQVNRKTREILDKGGVVAGGTGKKSDVKMVNDGSNAKTADMSEISALKSMSSVRKTIQSLRQFQLFDVCAENCNETGVTTNPWYIVLIRSHKTPGHFRMCLINAVAMECFISKESSLTKMKNSALELSVISSSGRHLSSEKRILDALTQPKTHVNCKTAEKHSDSKAVDNDDSNNNSARDSNAFEKYKIEIESEKKAHKYVIHLKILLVYSHKNITVTLANIDLYSNTQKNDNFKYLLQKLEALMNDMENHEKKVTDHNTILVDKYLKALETHDELLSHKNNLENEMLGKFLLILNEKKIQARRFQQQIGKYKILYEKYRKKYETLKNQMVDNATNINSNGLQNENAIQPQNKHNHNNGKTRAQQIEIETEHKNEDGLEAHSAKKISKNGNKKKKKKKKLNSNPNSNSRPSKYLMKHERHTIADQFANKIADLNVAETETETPHPQRTNNSNRNQNENDNENDNENMMEIIMKAENINEDPFNVTDWNPIIHTSDDSNANRLIGKKRKHALLENVVSEAQEPCDMNDFQPKVKKSKTMARQT